MDPLPHFKEPMPPDPRATLRRLIDERLDFSSPLTDAVLPQLLGSTQGSVAAVVHYGSCLTRTAAADSEPDFYIIVDRLRDWHEGQLPVLLNLVLPPNIYHPTFQVDGQPRTSKMCVIAGWQLRRETSAAAADLYHLGRFSKPMGLIYARDAAARRLVIDAQASAIELLTPLALTQLGPRFTLEEFLLALLGLSYLSEQRITEPTKIKRLLEQHEDHLLEIGRCTLVLARTRRGDLEEDGAGYRQVLSAVDAARLERLLARSRRRAFARWPKHIMTFDGWLDYLLAKLERNSGIRLDLTPAQRRHPVLLAWPRMLDLWRRGFIK
jgi:hypothetical protein